MTWTLTFVRSLKSIQAPSSFIEHWTDLLDREADLGIHAGQPILLPPSGRPDKRVIQYLNSASFRRLSQQTQLSYAKDLKIYFSYLVSQNKDWRDATDRDLENFEFWRRRDPSNEKRISGTKFSRELAAIVGFYKWQVSKGFLESSPVVVRSRRLRNGELVDKIALAPTNARRTNVKWLTSRAYRMWRDVGLGGYKEDGLRDGKWKGRMAGRNIAFTDLLWSSGLRLTEGASLLTFEIPEHNLRERFIRGRIGEAVAKGGAKRDFWIASNAVERIKVYVEVDRHLAIKRAQHEGRYNELPNILIFEKLAANRILYFSTNTGQKQKIPLDQLTLEMRSRLYFSNDDGLEPAYLWLSERGMPLPVETWEAVFSVANQRCQRHSLSIYCHPHMLRHSFALKMLVTLMHVFERRMCISSEERREYRMIFGDPWSLVQTLLGHRSSEITRNTYLEPVNGIQIELFLNDTFDDQSSIDDLLSKIAADSELVTDIPKEL